MAGEVERLDDGAIYFLASKLSNRYLAGETERILSCLKSGSSKSQTDLQKESFLSFHITRDAVLMLVGAGFIDFVQCGLSKMYSLTPSGIRLVQILNESEEH